MSLKYIFMKKYRKLFLKAKKKCLVYGNPTDPTFLGPTLNFLGHLRIFLLFLGYTEWFSYFFLYKNFPKKKSLPTNPKKYWDISGNKTYVFFWPNDHLVYFSDNHNYYLTSLPTVILAMTFLTASFFLSLLSLFSSAFSSKISPGKPEQGY